jgi:lincosamide nucleotidyltransferase A/C/D/E
MKFGTGLRRLPARLALLRHGDSTAVIPDWFSRLVRQSSPKSPLGLLVSPFWARLARGEMTAAQVLTVTRPLEADGVRFWVAGGWGVEAVTGVATRRHSDLDLVVADYENDEPAVRSSLEKHGYRRTDVRDGEFWMAPCSLLLDPSGHQIEILGLNWTNLGPALGLASLSASTALSPAHARELFAVGTIAGVPVPCLSAKVQLLIHGGFQPRGVDRYDLRHLRRIVSESQTPQSGEPSTTEV